LCHEQTLGHADTTALLVDLARKGTWPRRFDEAADYKGVHGFFLVPDSSAASSSLFAVCAAAIASSLVVAVPILTNFRSLWRMTSHRNPRGEMSFTNIPNVSITHLHL